MANSSEALPRFKKPPVIETVLGVHFRPLEKFTSAHQGLLWERCFRERFPKLEERPPVEELRELFDEERLGVPMIRWQVFDRPPASRLWAASEDGQHVIQIQKNALFAGWLKTGEEVAYYPYAERREEFSQQLEQVQDFFRAEGIGQLEPTTWSVTYINHIDYEGFRKVGPAVARTLTFWTNESSDTWLPEPDKVALDFTFPMPDNAGRLNVNLTTAVRAERQEARVASGLDGAGATQDEGRSGRFGRDRLGARVDRAGFCLAYPPRDAPSMGENSMTYQEMVRRTGSRQAARRITSCIVERSTDDQQPTHQAGRAARSADRALAKLNAIGCLSFTGSCRRSNLSPRVGIRTVLRAQVHLGLRVRGT